jgi:hypothetical protein
MEAPGATETNHPESGRQDGDPQSAAVLRACQRRQIGEIWGGDGGYLGNVGLGHPIVVTIEPPPQATDAIRSTVCADR